jgi:hypothetical protein
MRTVALALTAALLPFVPAEAATKPSVTAWVVERTAPGARSLSVSGGSGAGDGEHAFAAVASATLDARGRFSDAEGALFFGSDPDSDPGVSSPAGTTRCSDVPAAAQVCASSTTGAGIGFVVWWDDATFDRAFVVLAGRGKQVAIEGSGWRLRRWTGPVRVVYESDLASAGTVLGRGAAAFNAAESWGGPGGSVAIGKLPCLSAGYTQAGGGAVRLTGGTAEKLATCADWYPPAAAAPAGTEWLLDGAAAGASDTIARLVVVERPLR